MIPLNEIGAIQASISAGSARHGRNLETWREVAKDGGPHVGAKP